MKSSSEASSSYLDVCEAKKGRKEREEGIIIVSSNFSRKEQSLDLSFLTECMGDG
jgi:hypothetical protein